MRALLLLLVLLQDNPKALVEQLGSDDVRERDAATRRLEALGLEAVEKLQAQPGCELEVRARLRQIAATLKKRAEMAKVFGPTKRVTADFRQRKLGEVLSELGKQLGETFESESIDSEKTIDLELKGATLWETLEALGRAAGVRTEYGDPKVLLQPGPRQELPSKCVEQFRIAVTELKRMEHRAPGRADRVGVVTLLASYQRNMQPVDGFFHESLVIDSVVDAAGKDLKIEHVEWANSRMIGHHPHSMLCTVLVRPDDGPFTVEGRTQIRFECDRVEVSISLEEGNRKARQGEFAFDLDEVVQTANGLQLKVHVKADEQDPRQRLKVDSVWVVDGKGNRHQGSSNGGSSGWNSMTRRFSFPAVEKPERVIVTWITEFHNVEIPFRFEGLRIP
jgi:hypothetical protein